ncbi:hypothetical protein GQ607_011864 [Colletotrichum asianum]|uniref:Uncharacterized protein n=1 Tax=Colletotrichum asianum TaxID=702518 RepID=A0A8H3ZMH5_9PEZI|nr:hypothetical protein GQ607_011864 [Colletotrichum asianum]
MAINRMARQGTAQRVGRYKTVIFAVNLFLARGYSLPRPFLPCLEPHTLLALHRRSFVSFFLFIEILRGDSIQSFFSTNTTGALVGRHPLSSLLNSW